MYPALARIQERLYPLPVSLSLSEGEFFFGNRLHCFLSDQILSSDQKNLIADLFSSFCMDKSSLVFLPLPPGREETLLACTSHLPADESANSDNMESENSDGYSLCITPSLIRIKASGAQNLLHGFFTLLQLIEADSLVPGKEKYCLPCLHIRDFPATPFRGVHLCIFPETPFTFIEKAIRLAGFLKYTHIVLEPWGMIPFSCFPQCAWPNAYTKEQIRSLVRQANAFGMEVVPCLNHLGHASSCRANYGRHTVLSRTPALATLFEPDGWTWCISNPDVRNLLRKIREEFCDLCGDGSFFHIGCDEAWSFGSCRKCSLTPRSLLTEYLNEICNHLSSLGRRPIMWGDMLLDPDYPYGDDIIISPYSIPPLSRHEKLFEIAGELNRRILIADWQYDPREKENFFLTTTDYFQKKGFDVLLCPWNDAGGIFSLGASAQNQHAHGFLLTTWHTLPEHMDTLVMGSEASWCGMRQRENFGLVWMKAGEWQRKICPCSDYTECGFKSLEVVY